MLESKDLSRPWNQERNWSLQFEDHPTAVKRNYTELYGSAYTASLTVNSGALELPSVIYQSEFGSLAMPCDAIVAGYRKPLGTLFSEKFSLMLATAFPAKTRRSEREKRWSCAWMASRWCTGRLLTSNRSRASFWKMLRKLFWKPLQEESWKETIHRDDGNAVMDQLVCAIWGYF